MSTGTALTEEQNEIKKEKWRIAGHWLRVAVEFVAFWLLCKEVIPSKIIEPYKDTGIAIIILLGSCTIMSIIMSYKERSRSERKNFLLKERNSESIKAKDQEIQLLENANISLKRTSRYALIFPLLNKVFLDLHLDFTSKLSEPQCKNVLKNFCNSLVVVFEEITKEHCHVCIKIIGNKGAKSTQQKINKLKAGTIVRDGLRTSRSEIDTHKIDHLFNLNSDYEHIYEKIFSPNERYYFCNDILAESEYKNTSFSMIKPGTHTFSCDQIAEKDLKWPLPYKSTMCVPIILPRNNDQSKNTLVGFLCVDSPQKNIFNKESEIPILIGCADALYRPIQYYFELHLKNKKDESQRPFAKPPEIGIQKFPIQANS